LRIAEWGRAGGAILTAQLTTDLELNTVSEYAEFFGIIPSSDQAAGIARHRIVASSEFAANDDLCRPRARAASFSHCST